MKTNPDHEGTPMHGKDYYVASAAQWLVTRTCTQREARRVGSLAFGSKCLRIVRRATEVETALFGIPVTPGKTLALHTLPLRTPRDERPLPHYYVEGGSGWFVVAARTKRHAHRAGVYEFGRGITRLVRRATPDETASYVAQKGADALRHPDD